MNAPETIEIGLISLPDGRRPVDEEAVKRLAKSIKEIGLKTPITVLDADGGETLELVAGSHRIEAFKSLGRKSIPCYVIEGNRLEADMWEIAENLHRAELTTLQRDEQIAKWIELSKARVSVQLAQKPKGGRPKGGLSDASRELGIQRNDAIRAAQVASLTDEAKKAAVETGLDDNRSALLNASRQPPEKQASSIVEFAERKKSGVERDVKQRAADEVAEILTEYVPGDAWDILKANLYAAGASNIANSLTNLTGNSVMDKAGYK